MSDGGTNDGAGAHGNDGSFAIYELVHPLNSADDLHDFSLSAGQTFGLSLLLSLFSPTGAAAGTFFPGPSLFNYQLLTITP